MFIPEENPFFMNARALSKELFKLFYCQPGISNNTTHRKRVDGVIAWNGDNTNPVGHHNVFALTNNSEAGFLESFNCIKVVDARNLGHA